MKRTEMHYSTRARPMRLGQALFYIRCDYGCVQLKWQPANVCDCRLCHSPLTNEKTVYSLYPQ